MSWRRTAPSASPLPAGLGRRRAQGTPLPSTKASTKCPGQVGTCKVLADQDVEPLIEILPLSPVSSVGDDAHEKLVSPCSSRSRLLVNYL